MISRVTIRGLTSSASSVHPLHHYVSLLNHSSPGVAQLVMIQVQMKILFVKSRLKQLIKYLYLIIVNYETCLDFTKLLIAQSSRPITIQFHVSY